MHPITLNAAASVLLLSSVISIGLVLKRTPKSRLKSSNSVLSMTDVASCVLTALIVLLHRYYIGDDHEFDYRVNKLNNTRYFYETVFKSRSDYDGNNATNVDDAAEEKCDYKGVLLQYAMFLVPFANAFVSLLSFSTSFYANAMKMNCRCCELADCREDLEKSAEKSDKGTTDTSSLKSTRSDRRKSKFFNGEFTSLAIVSQWIIPALFTGVFQFGEYQRVKVSNDVGEDLICTITANFPLENCIENLDSTAGILSVDSVGSYSSIRNYVDSEDNLLWPNPNTTEVSDVVSKIYDIVQSVANDSNILNATLADRHYNITQLLEMMSNERVKNLTTMHDLNFSEDNTEVKENSLRNFDFTKMKQRSQVIHSFADKVSNVNEQSELNSMMIMNCLKNRCTISTKFLRVYLFALLTLIYFAPIFVSALILVKSYYKCREATEKLEDGKSKLEAQIQRRSEVAHEETTRRQQSNALQLGWFTENANEEIEQEAAAADVEETEQNKVAEASWSAFEKIACELTCETEKMRSLFKIFKVNAMVAVALWTPFFLQILTKVFLCSNVPNWLMETTFLATIVFSVFKNAVNVNVIKIEADSEKVYKDNTVHPSKLDLA